MNITLGIPTYNRPKSLISTVKQFLNDVDQSTLCEIIIIDQTKWEDIEQVFQKELEVFQNNPLIKYYNEPTPSLPLARNKIISRSKGDIIVWIDDDVIVNRNFIIDYLNVFQNNDCVACAGQIFQRNDSADENLINKHNYTNYCHTAYQGVDLKPFDSPLIGCNHATLKSSLLQVSGVDENYRGSGYFSDADLGNRLRLKFGKDSILLSEKASLIHLKAKVGGCKINNIKRSEKDSLYPFVFYFFRYRINKFDFLKGMYEILRVGPLRKQNVIKLKSFYSFFILVSLIFEISKTKHSINDVKSLLNKN